MGRKSDFDYLKIFLYQADRNRREKLRRKREEEEEAAGKNDSSRIVEVTDEEAEKITRENAQAKVKILRKRIFKIIERIFRLKK
jgi:hypothetical protein